MTNEDLTGPLRERALAMDNIGRTSAPLSAATLRNAAARIDRLQAELDAANLELRKQSGIVKAIYDRDVWDRARADVSNAAVITHYEGCYDGGPRHYACAMLEINRLKALTRLP